MKDKYMVVISLCKIFPDIGEEKEIDCEVSEWYDTLKEAKELYGRLIDEAQQI